ncbi:hypothetical protein EVAR_35590_1 [Eumeta japonica]|uniref:Uncharacterized protein n=1 Tax=Eumeta variegata TaxID=151549 RepID=A0A4C1XK94_EUMVA|nr:hypothetical protein EVAR_35590_1 [Eumeta japonica]
MIFIDIIVARHSFAVRRAENYHVDREALVIFSILNPRGVAVHAPQRAVCTHARAAQGLAFENLISNDTHRRPEKLKDCDRYEIRGPIRSEEGDAIERMTLVADDASARARPRAGARRRPQAIREPSWSEQQYIQVRLQTSAVKACS